MSMASVHNTRHRHDDDTNFLIPPRTFKVEVKTVLETSANFCYHRGRAIKKLPERLPMFPVPEKLWNCIVEKEDLVVIEPTLGEVSFICHQKDTAGR